MKIGQRVSSTLFFVLGLTVALTSAQEAVAQRDRDGSLTPLRGLSGAFQALSERVSPAVVQILATGYALPEQGDAPGSGLLTRRRIDGSGVIVDPEGYIVTNAHVIAGAGRVRVRLTAPLAETPSPGQSILQQPGRIVGASVVGLDRETDVAVLKIDESGLPALPFGDSDTLRKGQLVFAFGSPLRLENSVSMGVVSAVARQLRPEDPMIYIQTDASINPGNSGGPLVDAAGTIVGISTFILSQSGGSEGLGFAAPSNIVRSVYEQIRRFGYVRRGEIGVHAQTIGSTLVDGLNLPRGWGVLLGDVYPGGPADRAGLQIGDIVLTLDGKPMENGRQFDVNLYQRAVGDRVSIRVLRGADTLTYQVPVFERPDDVNRFNPMVSPDENLVRPLGILAVNLTSETAAMLPQVRGQSGVIVAARAPDAATGEGRLVPGDIIYSVNGTRVDDLAELRRALDDLGPTDPVVLHVERRGRLRFLAFELLQ